MRCSRSRRADRHVAISPSCFEFGKWLTILELTGKVADYVRSKERENLMKLARAILMLILAIAALMQPGSADLFAGNELPEERPAMNAPLRVVIDFPWFDDLAEAEQAIEGAETAARRQPDSAERQFELGMVYFKVEINEDWPKGVEAFKAAIRIKPDYAEAYCKLGEAYDLMHYFSLEYAHPREEREAFEKAIQVRTDCAEAYVELGRHILIDDGGTNSRRAEEFFKQAIAFAPDYIEAYDGLAQAYYDQDRKEDAWKVSAQALLVNPNRSESYYSLYGCCEGDARDKIEVFNEAIRLRPNNVPAYRCLGMIYRDLGRYEEAIQAYRELLRIAPRYDEAYYELGSIFLAMGTGSRRWINTIRSCGSFTGRQGPGGTITTRGGHLNYWTRSKLGKSSSLIMVRVLAEGMRHLAPRGRVRKGEASDQEQSEFGLRRLK